MIPRVGLRWCLTIAVSAFWFCLPVGVCSAAVQATFYVAPNGSDANPGTEAAPLATVDGARQAVRAVNKQMTGDIVVVLRGGTYRIDRTLVFLPEDSGTGGHDVIYRAVGKETPIISGGKAITGWRADANGRWTANTDLDDFRQLYVGGVRAIRARSGKLGEDTNASRWEFLRDPSRGGGLPEGSELIGNEGYRTPAVEMADWRNVADVEFCYNVVWAHTRCKVAEHSPRGRPCRRGHASALLHAREDEGRRASRDADLHRKRARTTR